MFGFNFISKLDQMKHLNDDYSLLIKTVTWQKDSHSLFDYESNKNVTSGGLAMGLANKYVYMFRNNQNSQINFSEHTVLEYKNQGKKQLLGCFRIFEEGQKHFLQFYNTTEIREKDGSSSERTNSSVGQGVTPQKEQEIFLIIRSLKNQFNENLGYKLTDGQVLKLGRVQYLVTSANAPPNSSQNKTKFWANTTKIVVEQNKEQTEKAQCKYCYQGESQQTGFLCSPCKCSGSCGTVHFKCLQKWNQSKVRKQAVGGALHYNFQKFFCQVCKQQYPRYIQKDGKQHELLPIQKPEGQHVILQGISQKANNMIILQNVGQGGVKIGRGHDCEIRVTDISVSRNHALIQKMGNGYIVFDNKSKFGTLVREPGLKIQLNSVKQGIQIGRTVMTFEKFKK